MSSTTEPVYLGLDPQIVLGDMEIRPDYTQLRLPRPSNAVYRTVSNFGLTEFGDTDELRRRLIALGKLGFEFVIDIRPGQINSANLRTLYRHVVDHVLSFSHEHERPLID